MNSLTEKEKKLNTVLDKLKNLSFKNPELDNNIEELKNKKNQLEIEKKELEEKYKLLDDDYNSLSIKLQEMENQEKIQQKKHIEFSEKWINWIIIALIAFQVFLNLAAYNAALSGMNNMSLFFAGLILIVFAGLFHVYRYAMGQAKTSPPPPGAWE